MIAVAVLVAGCSSSDPTGSDEYAALEQELAQTNGELAQAETQLAEVTAERDTFIAVEELSTSRYDNAIRIHEEIIALLHDHEAVGTEEEVADLLATHATESAKMDDEVFGAVSYRAGFYNTLFAGTMDAEIDVYHDWLAEDGSQGGFLWVWHGTNAKGNPFSLPGISLTTHDDDGLISYEFVTYPYTDDYVRQSVFGDGN
jgi:hypothetical protein